VFTTLGRSNFDEWFTNIKELKSNYSHAIEIGYAFFNAQKDLPVLEKYPKLNDVLVTCCRK
jgi:tryptophan synthase alpha subunit